MGRRGTRWRERGTGRFLRWARMGNSDRPPSPRGPVESECAGGNRVPARALSRVRGCWHASVRGLFMGQKKKKWRVRLAWSQSQTVVTAVLTAEGSGTRQALLSREQHRRTVRGTRPRGDALWRIFYKSPSGRCAPGGSWKQGWTGGDQCNHPDGTPCSSDRSDDDKVDESARIVLGV